MPERWQILGLRLRPFSLGHYKLLKRHQCAFVSDSEQQASREDLIFGVLCCSMKVNEFEIFLDAPDFLEQVKEWGAKIGLFDCGEKAKLFKDYLDAHNIVPPYWEENEGTASGAHWSQCVEVTLRSKVGWSKEEIDSEPLSKAFADYFKYAESEGMIRLMTSQEIQFVNSNG